MCSADAYPSRHAAADCVVQYEMEIYADSEQLESKYVSGEYSIDSLLLVVHLNQLYS